jgi:hypothetical protein
VTAAELYVDFQLERAAWKGGDLWRKARVRDAYQRFFHASCAEGNPPDALRRHIADETERFFARTIPGVDGHTYWDGSLKAGFVQNDGHTRRPRRWWYERVYGSLGRDTLIVSCGEANCITPEHMERVPWEERRRMWSDAQMIGMLQTVAMRLGETPSRHGFDKERSPNMPTARAYILRFGSWGRAVKSAGLPERDLARISTDDTVAALRAFADERGHVPSLEEWQSNHCHPVRGTIVRLFGGWGKALIAAGLTDRQPVRRDWSREAIVAAMRAVAAEFGRVPTAHEWEVAGYRPNRKTIVRAFGSYPAAREVVNADAASVEDAQTHKERGF